MWASITAAIRNKLGGNAPVHDGDPAEARYAAAYRAHWDAVARADTRSIKETRQDLLAAQTDRLMREVWG
jgi:hypothetical protein